MTTRIFYIKKDLNILNELSLIIERYLNKSIYIGDVIYDLESGLNQLTIIDNEWKKDFRTTWLDIEVSYALSLDKGLDSPNQNEEHVILESLNLLYALIERKKSDLKQLLNEDRT